MTADPHIRCQDPGCQSTMEALRTRNQELEALSGIAKILAQPGRLEERTTRVLEVLAGIAQTDWATLRMLDEKEQALRLVATESDLS